MDTSNTHYEMEDINGPSAQGMSNIGGIANGSMASSLPGTIKSSASSSAWIRSMENVRNDRRSRSATMEPSVRKQQGHISDSSEAIHSSFNKVGAHSVTWNIHWKSPTLMFIFLIAGISFALGHHFHYCSLDSTSASSEGNQQWAIRIGTGFAFLCKATLVASVGISYTQRLWVTVKVTPMSLQSLDNAFSLTTDPVSFLNSSVIFRARVLCFLAACMWCIPIVATITPATLSIRPGTLSKVIVEKVPSPEYSSTDNSSAWVNWKGVGKLDASSAAVHRLVAATTSSLSILPFMAPYPNSSYTLTFDAPAFRCETLSTAISGNNLNLKQPELLQEGWDTSIDKSLHSLAPGARPLYIANASNFFGTYNHMFVYAGKTNHSETNYSCHLWNSSYTVDFEFSDGIQSTSIKTSEHRNPTNISGDEVFNHNQQPDVAYWSLFNALSGLLETQVFLHGNGTLTGADTDIFKSGIPACPGIVETLVDNGVNKCVDPWMCRAGSVPAAVEDLSHNVSLSLISSNLFSGPSGSGVPVTVSRPQNYYAYNRRNLLCAYATATAVAAVCVGIGVRSYRVNGYSASSSFSSILFTTRNPDLDRLARGRCLGAQPIPDDVKRTVLRYGLLRREGREGRSPHAAFGLAEGVANLTRGDLCH